MDNNLKQKIEEKLSSHPVILFMKGDRVFPQCGFSAKVVDILDETGVAYETFDILTDSEIREGLKIYSSWPTFPQLYVRAELIGGCDIISDLYEKNELKKLFVEKEVLSA
ncbi:MAG: monothiol glutaredoxin, Grx4 family [Deltaproteobacteria bacterium CG11_big_fil_rev_8_21_14_0_20_45_16]|nr:MAG: monothiol glutaredoxin, Grx4 family [Deltaproteobacteria bacterium CG11_big_fil_rev_8_21_14_0_20_45_16]